MLLDTNPSEKLVLDRFLQIITPLSQRRVSFTYKEYHPIAYLHKTHFSYSPVCLTQMFTSRHFSIDLNATSGWSGRLSTSWQPPFTTYIVSTNSRLYKKLELLHNFQSIQSTVKLFMYITFVPHTYIPVTEGPQQENCGKWRKYFLCATSYGGHLILNKKCGTRWFIYRQTNTVQRPS